MEIPGGGEGVLTFVKPSKCQTQRLDCYSVRALVPFESSESFEFIDFVSGNTNDPEKFANFATLIVTSHVVC